MLTALALLAFAGNSLLCRAALAPGAIGPAGFTAVRIASGALALALLVRARRGADAADERGGDWPSAFALFAYAAGFSFAYVRLTAATGALLLFGAVQATMLVAGLRGGERVGARAALGLALALAGLAVLLVPRATLPELVPAVLMIAAGVAWGAYSLLGRGSLDPLGQTAGNFWRAVVPAAALSVAFAGEPQARPAGLALAVASGAVASGLGYAVWYAALRRLPATRAATVQLAVPVIAAAGGVVLLGEPLTWTLAIAAPLVLGGIALSQRERPRKETA
jgi:drug/metabolite transporter (DMT)-like permease